MALIFVDVEANGPSVSTGCMTEFGAVEYESKASFYGRDDTAETMSAFRNWLTQFSHVIFVSDNVAFDWQWINDAFHKHLGVNPFGHSGRRISDYYAGLMGNFRRTQDWKRWRITPHDHNPVNDAMGNVEAFGRIQEELAHHHSSKGH